MGLACGQWGWGAEDFWRATPMDVSLIAQGLRRMQSPDDLTHEDVAELRARLNEKG